MSAAFPSGFHSAASRLLAFHQEPVHWRHRYLNGREAMPDGGVVLRLALGTPQAADPALAQAATAFVRQVCLSDRATHYQVLCLEPGAGARAIREHYRLLMSLLHPDRPASGSAWPPECAQRVNRAYETLADDRLKRDYDATLGVGAGGIAAGRAAGRHRPRAAFVRLMRRAMVVAALLVALFMVQAWWVDDLPQGYSLLERAAPMGTSARWVRDALADTGLPRFLRGGGEPIAFEPLPPLPPPKERPSWVAEARLAVPEMPAPAAPSTAVPREAPVERPTVVVTRPEAALREARATAAPSPLRLVQALPSRPVAPPAAASEGPMAVHVETLVAMIVSYYESGDVDGLMGLYDAEALGFWKAMRTRGRFGDFFGTTSQRRLRLDRLTWKGDAQSAQARGDATVIAQYRDGARTLERAVPIEFEVALREGQPRLTRLTLFPEEG